MEVSKLSLEQYRGIRKIDITFHPRLNIFTGVNGVGKSSILDGLALMLSQCRSLTTDRIDADTKDINNNSDCFEGSLTCSQGNGWFILSKLNYSAHSLSSRYFENKTANFEHMEEQGPLASLLKAIENSTDLSLSFPIVAYYPTNRAIIDVPERIRGFTPATNQLDALDGALWSNIDFRSFIARFRESENVIHSNNDSQVSLLSEADSNRSGLFKFKEWHKRQVSAIRAAIEFVIPSFKNLHVEQRPFNVTIEKGAKKLSILQLSDGEKCLVALLGDLAQRLSIANPGLKNPLEGEGIVLIDEIDLHLHPSWQRMVISKLLEIFPNCQFIVTTHSPQVLGEVAPESVHLLYENEGMISHRQPAQTKGLDSSELLFELMETDARNPDITNRLNKIFELIDEGNFIESQRLLSELKQITHGPIPEIIRAENLIAMLS